jgi:hypothetical protein
LHYISSTQFDDDDVDVDDDDDDDGAADGGFGH